MSRRNRKHTIWLKETSDQSGFDNFRYDGTTWHKKWTSITQKGLTIAPNEFDTPPPSNKPLGGADVSGDPRANSLTYDVPSVSAIQIQYITAAGGISSALRETIYVSGSNATIDITAARQVSPGQPQQIMSIMCVGSGIILEEGSGLALISGRTFSMQSGSIFVAYYSGTDNLWHETSRVQNGGI